MPQFGSHVSVAGGLHRGIERALEVGCDCLQVFTKNNNRWAAKPLEEAAVDAWRKAFQASDLKHPIAHASYLINLAAPDDKLFAKSVDALVDELQRATRLGLEGVVVHPGAYTTSCEADGLKRIVDGATEVLQRLAGPDAVDRAELPADAPGCRLLLENTAGQGSCLGHSVDHLAELVQQISSQVDGLGGRPSADQLGVCLDTCHAFAAGVDWNDPDALVAYRTRLQDELPVGSVRALHLNDSKKPLGSRVDRHEHIGRGAIGEAGFVRILTDEFFAEIPGYLETEKGVDEASGNDWDVVNLSVLRRLAAA